MLDVSLRTFRHAVKTSQIASFCDTYPQVVMLPIEGIGQKVRERFRFLDCRDALL